MRWLFCLLVLASALGGSLAFGQNEQANQGASQDAGNAATAPQIMVLIPDGVFSPSATMASANPIGSPAPRTICVPHWTISLSACSVLNGAPQSAAWDQGTLDTWAADPDRSPDPQCVRSNRVWHSC